MEKMTTYSEPDMQALTSWTKDELARGILRRDNQIDKLAEEIHARDMEITRLRAVLAEISETVDKAIGPGSEAENG
jgi:hypothetical protein